MEKSTMKNSTKVENRLWFTLVELIVTITILAVLWTISFLWFQSYTTYSRDVVCVTDLNNIKSVLEYTYTESWRYPVPDEWSEITYSGWTVWTQWEFWKKSKRAVKRLDKVPTDLLTQNQYTYSVLNTNSEYELWAVFEGDEVVMLTTISPHLTSPKGRGIIGETHADQSDFKSYITWNYNWQIAKVNTGWLDYILAVPSIISSDIVTSKKLEDIITNKKLSFKWHKNIPHSYWVEYTPWDPSEVEFVKTENLVVYSWTWVTKKLEDPAELKILADNLQKAYSWSALKDNSNYTTLLNIDTENDSQINSQIWTLTNKRIWTKIEIGKVVATSSTSSNYIFPAWTKLVMDVCPSGWNDLGDVRAWPTLKVNLNWTDWRTCESTWQEILSWTKLVMDVCPSGWNDLGYVRAWAGLPVRLNWTDWRTCEKN